MTPTQNKILAAELREITDCLRYKASRLLIIALSVERDLKPYKPYKPKVVASYKRSKAKRR